MNLSSNLPDALTNTVLACISRPDYYVEPPKLSADLWDRVCILNAESKAENERLEFLGDALMDACFALELYKQIPDGTPHMYTEIRSALHRNLAFCHLANKMGLTTTGHTKSIGDVFETLVGAYYTEKGFDSLYEWTKRTYQPLIDAAIDTYYTFQSRFPKVSYEETETSSYSDPSSPGSPVTPKTPSQRKGKHRQNTSISTVHPTASSSTLPRLHGLPPSLPRSVSVRDATPSPPPTPSTSDDPDDIFHSFGSSLNINDRPDLSPTAESPSRPPGYFSASHLDLSNSQQPRLQSQARASSSILMKDERPLPEFWEELHMPDGRVVFVDHKHQVTTWEDPRNSLNAMDAIGMHNDGPRAGEPDAWTARLVAPLHEAAPGEGWVPRYHPGDRFFEGTGGSTTLPSAAVPSSSASTTTGKEKYDPPPLSIRNPFPDLRQDGYTLQSADQTTRRRSLLDFCEVREGSDGHEYYIDHANQTIMRKR